MKKNIIIEKDLNDNNSSKNQIDKNTVINELFKELFVTKDKFDINKIFGDKTPFYLCIQKYNCNNAEKNIDEEICLLLNENEKNKKLVEILNNLEQSNFPNEQIILKIYWNLKYTNNVIKYLRPEKIDSFLNKLINFDEKINSKSIQNLNGLKQIENNTNKEEIIILDNPQKTKKSKYIILNDKLNTLNNKDKYKELGCVIPHGLLLYGEPGLGKSTFAFNMIETLNRKSYVIRKNKSDGSFINYLNKVFEEIK